MPTTTMPSTAKAIAMARMLAQVRKYSEANDMTTNSSRMIRISPVSRMRSSRLHAAGRSLGACRSLSEVAIVIAT